MKYGLDIPTAGEYANPRKLANLAAEAEQAGWDGFFVWDIFVGDQAIVDPWVALAAIAMQTQHIRIGAFVTPLPRRRPWEVARETVALDHLSNGRLIFAAGLGHQGIDYTAFGEESDPKIRAEKLDESLEILNGLWTGETFSFHGKHYQVNEVKFLPKPLQSPRIPIWLAGGWPKRKPFQRAARWDGISLMTVNQVTNELLTPQEIREIVAYVKAHRESPEPFDIAVNGETSSDLKPGRPGGLNTKRREKDLRTIGSASETVPQEYKPLRATMNRYPWRIAYERRAKRRLVRRGPIYRAQRVGHSPTHSPAVSKQM